MFFKVSIAIFLVNQFLQYYGTGNYFTICYLDDLLFFPVSYSLIDYYFKMINKDFKISIQYAIIGVIITSIVFELILPILSNRYTSDIYDILFYILGACLYMMFGKKKERRKNIPRRYCKKTIGKTKMTQKTEAKVKKRMNILVINKKY